MTSGWTLDDVAAELNGKASTAIEGKAKIKDFYPRAWSVTKNSVFAPLRPPLGKPGGQKLVRNAIGKGAIAAIVEDDSSLDASVPYILVDDVNASMNHLAHISRDRFRGRLVGVTGTAGKTTTVAMLSAILRAHGETWQTLNNNNLVPHVTMNACSLPPNAQYAVMELALSSDFMVADAAAIARPHIQIITSIGAGHAEAFDGQNIDPHEAVLRAKLGTMSHVCNGGVAILPSYSEAFKAMYDDCSKRENIGKIVTCGLLDSDDIQLVNYTIKYDSSDVVARIDDQELSYTIPYPGEHMVQNSLLAVAAAHELGVSSNVLANISQTKTTHSAVKRFRAEYEGKTFEIINDSSNTNDTIVKGFLKRAENTPRSARKILIISDIPALGERSKDIHRELAPFVDEAGFSLVITVGKHSAELADALKTRNIRMGNRFHALKALKEEMQHKDLVYIKGTKSLKFDDIVKLMQKWAEIIPAQNDWSVVDDV